MRRRPLRGTEAEKEPDTTDGEERKENGDVDEWISDRVHQKTEPFNPIAWAAVFFHLAMVVFYSLLLYHGINLMRENQHILDPRGKIPKYGGRFKYLTHINQWVQLAMFAVQVCADFLPRTYGKRKLQNICDLLFTTVAFPLSMTVAATFWGIYAVDRKLIYPEVFDKFVPPYLNHFWHTTIALWVVFEILLVARRFPSTGIAASVIFAFSAAYISWIVWVFVSTGWWVYPFLKFLPPYLMALFFGSCIFVNFGIFFIGKLVSYVRWGSIDYIDF